MSIGWTFNINITQEPWVEKAKIETEKVNKLSSNIPTDII